MDSNQLALRPISAKKQKDGSSYRGTDEVVAAAAPRERSSLANASFRVYYSLRAGAVPFLWESTPGTPKSAAGATAAVSPAETTAPAEEEVLPPISPPPSYQSPSSSQVKNKAMTTRSPAAATACGVLRAIGGVLGLGKSRRFRSRVSSSW